MGEWGGERVQFLSVGDLMWQNDFLIKWCVFRLGLGGGIGRSFSSVTGIVIFFSYQSATRIILNWLKLNNYCLSILKFGTGYTKTPF